MSYKGHTELQINVSGEKNREEYAGDVRFCVAPKKAEIHAKKPICPHQKSATFFFGVEKRNVGDRLKRVLAKFQADRKYV